MGIQVLCQALTAHAIHCSTVFGPLTKQYYWAPALFGRGRCGGRQTVLCCYCETAFCRTYGADLCRAGPAFGKTGHQFFLQLFGAAGSNKSLNRALAVWSVRPRIGARWLFWTNGYSPGTMGNISSIHCRPVRLSRFAQTVLEKIPAGLTQNWQRIPK